MVILVIITIASWDGAVGEGANQLEAGSVGDDYITRRPATPLQIRLSPASALSLISPSTFPLLAPEAPAGQQLTPARGHGNFEIGHAKLV